MERHEDLATAVRRGRNAVWICPPQAAYGAPLWDATAARLEPMTGQPGSRSLVVAPDVAACRDVAAVAGGAPVTALPRAARLLRETALARLVATPDAAAALVAQSALDLEALDHVVLAWPETLMEADHSAVLDHVLAEVRAAPRFLLAWDAARIEPLLERHAHRAPIFGRITDADLPLPVACRCAIIGPGGRPASLERVLDAVNPARPAVWRLGEPAPGPGHDLVIAYDLPSADGLTALVAAGPVVVLVTGGQLSFLRHLCAGVTALPVSPAPELARDRGAELRATIAETIERASLDAELLLLDPLFERFDAAVVAAALARLRSARAAPEAAPTPSLDDVAWVRIFINTGRKDRVGAGDLVGALINEVGLRREHIGRIDLHDRHSTVEIAASVAGPAAQRLTGVVVRGRRLSARPDRR